MRRKTALQICGSHRFLRFFHRNFSNIRAERTSFGSFHSENIETLIRLSDEEFHPPDVFYDLHDQTIGECIRKSHQHPVDYGSDAKRRLFHLSDDWTFINHGAFGGAVRPMLQQAHLWREYCENQPLRFFDRELFPLVAHSLRTIAKGMLNCPPSELVPLQNVTAGLNAIFQSTQLSAGDEILHLSFTYGSTKKMMKDLAMRTKATLIIVPLNLPVESSQFIKNKILNYVNQNTKLIVLDQITSNTAMELPVVDIAKDCKAVNPNVRVVVDAAHSLFSQPISIYPHEEPQTSNSASSISSVVDFWLTNGHKWFSAPKGCAFMWISPKVEQIRPAILSHGYQFSDKKSSFSSRDAVLSSFVWDGCRDYFALVTAASGVDFWKKLSMKPNSGRKIDSFQEFRLRLFSLLDDAEAIIKDSWGLCESDFPCSIELRRNVPMRLIPLPRFFRGINTRDSSDKDAFAIQVCLGSLSMLQYTN